MQPNKKFYWFGDSWVYGSELKNPETDCFTKLVSDEFGAECINLGVPCSSIEYIVFEFMQVKDKIREQDNVFFFLTERSRHFILHNYDIPKRNTAIENGGPWAHILANTEGWMDVPGNAHPNNWKWYKYFDCDEQQQWSLDRNLFLLTSACPSARFANIFSINDSSFVESNKWLLPSNQCIAQYVLPHVSKGFNLNDHPGLTVEEWEEQKVFVDRYFAGGNASHPNKEGHQVIAEELCKLI